MQLQTRATRTSTSPLFKIKEKPMRKSVHLIVTVAILLSAMLSASTGSAQAANAKWTVMVYISGDNNLEDYVVKDIELELAPTGSNANVQVVALADRAP